MAEYEVIINMLINDACEILKKDDEGVGHAGIRATAVGICPSLEINAALLNALIEDMKSLQSAYDSGLSKATFAFYRGPKLKNENV